MSEGKTDKVEEIISLGRCAYKQVANTYQSSLAVHSSRKIIYYFTFKHVFHMVELQHYN